MDRNRGGRPRKSDGPRVPYEELDRILVFGEVVPCEDGNGTTVVYPSYRELADRYGVSNSVIADYAKTHNVQRRRREAQARVQAKAEHKIVEMRANAIALSKDDELRIIDGYIAGFEKAIAEGRVRFDNPADFNTMVRLKEFVMGNADSRQEIHAALSLESLQARHRTMIRTADASPAERGEVEATALPSSAAEDAPDPPAAPTAGADQKPDARFSGRFDDPRVTTFVAASGATQPQQRVEGSSAGDAAPHDRSPAAAASRADSVASPSSDCSSDDEANHRSDSDDPSASATGTVRAPAHARGNDGGDDLEEAVADTVRPAPLAETEG